MTGYFDALPKSSLNMGKVLKWVQEGTNTFYRTVTFRGDITLNGYLRTAGSGARIEIRPDGANNVPSVAWFDPDGQSAFAEIEDQGSNVYALKIAGPNAGGGAPIIKLREDGIGVLDSDNANGFWEIFKYLKPNAPVRLAAGDAAAPSLTFQSQQNKGVFDATTDAIGVSIAGSEVARFTGDAGHNLQGLAWTTWTPTLTNLNVGSTGTVVARYCRMGMIVFFDIHVTLGGTGISVGDATFSVPIAENAGYSSGSDDRVIVGEGTFIDAATGIYPAAVTIDDGVLRPRAYSMPATYLLQTSISSTIPFTWVAGDRMWLHGWYEAAA